LGQQETGIARAIPGFSRILLLSRSEGSMRQHWATTVLAVITGAVLVSDGGYTL
jgi:hypothetical protein